MKKVFIYLSILTMVLGITAFECGSAELEGAKLYIRQKQYDKAKEVLLKEVAKNPASDEGWSMLGKLYSEEGNIPKMLEAFDKSLAVSKKFEVDIKEFKKYSWATSFNKGVSYFNSAIATTKQDSINIFFEKAVEQFNYSIMCEPDSTIGYENIAAAYLNMGKREEAVPVLEKLTKIGKPAYSFSRLGALYLTKGADLMDGYRKSKNKADSVDAFGWYNKAISVLETGRAKFPADADILLQLGNVYYSSDKIDVATASFKDLVEKNPSNKEMRYAYGVVLLKGRKYIEAASQLEQVVKMDASNIDACYNLAATYINWGNDLRDEALKKENNDKSYQEKFKLAAPLLEKYLSVKPNDARVWMSLGQVYAHLGMEDKSKAAFKKADEYK
ncbi:MAG: tetratricopeptide repeat protein [Ignavibacteriales bacterium]|nr:tetratricopeptide repeat protein [Ignavibacteriales bacterium]